MIKNREKISARKGESLFVVEGKNDILIVGVMVFLLAFILVGGFFLK